MSLYSKEKVYNAFKDGGLKESSARSYASALSTLFKRMDSLQNKDMDEFSKAFDLSEFETKFKDLKHTTRRNYISAIISWLKVNKETNTKLFEALSKERDDLHTVYERIIVKGEKTSNEKDKWMEVSELGDIFEKKLIPFFERINFDSMKKKTPVYTQFGDSDAEKIRDLTILSVYLYPFYDTASNFGVLRNDISTLIYKPLTGRKKKANPEDVKDTSKNYFICTTGGAGYIIMNDYKTSQKHGTIKIDLPHLVSTYLKKWAVFSELEDGDEMFPSVSKHHVTAILQKQMRKLGGKPISTQMLRKIYITETLGELRKKQEAVASSMMHTVETQGSVYTKKE
jgi:hypothetical protein